jgi:EmrB/QacA subfamily drug resistance transporter
MAVVMAGTFVAPLDSSIVNIALPAIAADLGARLTAVGWVATAYLLTNAALILTMGRLGDTWGLRKVYVSGFAVFGMASLACALSSTLVMLLAGRVAQALGAAMMFASGPAIIANTFPVGERGRALGMLSLAVSAGLMAGPLLGGLLVGSFGWSSIFLINVPLAIVVAALAWRVIPDDRPESNPFDLVGSALAAGALLSLLLGLSEVDRLGATSPAFLGLMALAVGLGAAFVAWERRHAHPMLALGLFRSRAFSVGAAAAVLTYLSLFALTFVMPFLLIRVQGIDTRAAGLVMAVTPAAMALVAPFAGRLSDRWGSRWLTTAGLVVLASALVWLSGATPTTSALTMAAGLLVAGAGAALFGAPNTSAILTGILMGAITGRRSRGRSSWGSMGSSGRTRSSGRSRSSGGSRMRGGGRRRR